MVKKQAHFPPAVPRLRSLRNAFRFVNNPIPVFDQYMLENGETFSFFLAGGPQKGIVSAEPAFIQHILQKNHRNYRKSKIQTETLARYLGHGLLTSEGDYWLRQRRTIQPGFHRKKLEALSGIILKVIDTYIEGFDKQKTTVDIYQQMMELTLRIVANSLFSNNLKEEDLHLIGHHITAIQEFIIRQIRQPYFNPWFHLSGMHRKYKRMSEEVNGTILNFIRERKATGGQYDDLLQMLLDVRYEDTREGMTDRQLVDESAILYVAGHETTANAMAWMFYLLSQHPEAVQKIREEVVKVLGEAPPSFADLPKLEYTLQVVEESLRLYPPAWITDRIAIEDDTIEGYHIPAGTMIIAYIYGAHHSPKRWEAPEEFRPERFSKAQKAGRESFSYLPFGGGPRLCIGQSFALMEMQMILARMVPRFDFKLLPDQQIELQPLVTLRPRYGIKMELIKR